MGWIVNGAKVEASVDGHWASFVSKEPVVQLDLSGEMIPPDAQPEILFRELVDSGVLLFDPDNAPQEKKQE